MLNRLPTHQLERMRQQIVETHASPEGVMSFRLGTNKHTPRVSANKRRVLGQLDAELARRAQQSETST